LGNHSWRGAGDKQFSALPQGVVPEVCPPEPIRSALSGSRMGPGPSQVIKLLSEAAPLRGRPPWPALHQRRRRSMPCSTCQRRWRRNCSRRSYRFTTAAFASTRESRLTSWLSYNFRRYLNRLYKWTASGGGTMCVKVVAGSDGGGAAMEGKFVAWVG